MEFHREKHLVPFLCAGSNVRRQNAAQWVNLQLLPHRSHRDHQSPALFFPTAPSRPVPLSEASAYVHNFPISSGQLAPSSPLRAVVTGEHSVSHTLCIMFEPFRWTNTAAVLDASRSPGRIFNYFSHPWHLMVGSTSGTGTRGGYRVSETRAAKLGLRAVSHTHAVTSTQPLSSLWLRRCFKYSCSPSSLSFLINIIFQWPGYKWVTTVYQTCTFVLAKQSNIRLCVCFPKM